MTPPAAAPPATFAPGSSSLRRTRGAGGRGLLCCGWELGGEAWEQLRAKQQAAGQAHSRRALRLTAPGALAWPVGPAGWRAPTRCQHPTRSNTAIRPKVRTRAGQWAVLGSLPRTRSGTCLARACTAPQPPPNCPLPARAGVVLFKHHDPLQFSLEQLQDLVDVSHRWFLRAAADQAAQDARLGLPHRPLHPLFVWNCLPRGGASQVGRAAQGWHSDVLALPVTLRTGAGRCCCADGARLPAAQPAPPLRSAPAAAAPAVPRPRPGDGQRGALPLPAAGARGGGEL